MFTAMPFEITKTQDSQSIHKQGNGKTNSSIHSCNEYYKQINDQLGLYESAKNKSEILRKKVSYKRRDDGSILYKV